MCYATCLFGIWVCTFDVVFPCLPYFRCLLGLCDYSGGVCIMVYCVCVCSWCLIFVVDDVLGLVTCDCFMILEVYVGYVARFEQCVAVCFDWVVFISLAIWWFFDCPLFAFFGCLLYCSYFV